MRNRVSENNDGVWSWGARERHRVSTSAFYMYAHIHGSFTTQAHTYKRSALCEVHVPMSGKEKGVWKIEENLRSLRQIRHTFITTHYEGRNLTATQANACIHGPQTIRQVDRPKHRGRHTAYRVTDTGG